MAESSFPWNSNSGDRKFDASDWTDYFGTIIGNGVFPSPSTGLQVLADRNMNVTLKTGRAWINGYRYKNSTDATLTVGTADGTLSRIDRVVIRWDLSSRTITAVVVAGTPAATPVAPDYQRDSDIWELVVADILVGAGITEITDSAITDQRLDSTLCGVVAGLVETIDTTAFNTQLEAWFSEYMGLSQQEYENYVAALDLQYDTFVDDITALIAHLDALLDTGVATGLQNQIYDKDFLSYATCDTAAGTAAKVATAATSFAYSLLTGVRVTVAMTYANSAAAPTLAYGGTDAKPIYVNGSVAASGAWAAGDVVDFAYDGTNWNITGLNRTILDDAISPLADKAVEITGTLLAAGWVGSSAPYTQDVTMAGVTSTSKGAIGLTEDATTAQYTAAAAAQLKLTAKAADSVTITAYGTVPTVAIPIVMIIVD